MMDRSEPHVSTNSSQLNSEASAARRLFNATGNFLNEHKDKAVAVLAAGALSLSLSACGAGAKEGPEPTQGPTVAGTSIESPTAEPSPVESEAPIENTLEVQSIPGDLPPEQLAQAAAELWQDWIFTGATAETIAQTDQEARAFGDLPNFFITKAEENGQRYADAYFVEGWENNPDLVSYYETTVSSNQEMLRVGLNRHLNEKPMFEVNETVSNVKELTPTKAGERIIQYDLTGTHENSETVYTPGTITNYYDTTDGTARLVGHQAVVPHQ